VRDELCILLGWNAPALPEPGFQLVFFIVRRTASYEMSSTTPNATNRSASNRKVQRDRPSGGSLHASVIKRASPFPSSVSAHDNHY